MGIGGRVGRGKRIGPPPMNHLFEEGKEKNSQKNSWGSLGLAGEKK